MLSSQVSKQKIIWERNFILIKLYILLHQKVLMIFTLLPDFKCIKYINRKAVVTTAILVGEIIFF